MIQHGPRTLVMDTDGRGVYPITEELAQFVAGAGDGLLHVFLRHTSASLLINENADPNVMHDLLAWLERVAPDGDPRYLHTEEGPDDMSAHLKATLCPVQLSIPVQAGRLLLGTWQGVYVVEHRTRAHRRQVVMTYQGL